MPAHQRLRLEDNRGFEQGREQPIKPDEDQAICSAQPEPRWRRPPQDNKLMPEKCRLGFASRMRSEHSDEQSAEQLHEVDHPKERIAHRDICASPDAIFSSHRLSMTRRRRLLGQALSQLPRRRRPGEITADLYSARMGRSCSPRLRCPMQLCPDPRRRLVVANTEHTTIRLDPRPSAPPNDERARECGVEEIDRDGIIEYSAHAGRRHRPAIRSTILIEPGRSCENAADQNRPAERQS